MAVRETAKVSPRLPRGAAPSQTAIRLAARKLGTSQRDARQILRARALAGKPVTVRAVRDVKAATLARDRVKAGPRGSLRVTGKLLLATVTGAEKHVRLTVTVKSGDDLAKAFYTAVRGEIDKAVAQWQRTGDVPSDVGKVSPEISEISELELDLL
jgi:hypothetical protein